MRKTMAVMLMVLAFTAAQTRADAQSREKSDRKPAATRPTSPSVRPSSGPSTRPSGPATKPSGPSARPVRPDVKPGGSTSKPNGPSTKPSGPASKPNGPSARPSGPSGPKPGGPAVKPQGPKPGGPKPGGPKPGGPRPDYGYRPGSKPGPHPPRPGFGPGPRPPKPPRPVIVVRPSYGSIIAANIASSLVRSAVRAASRPVYVTVPERLSLTHSYVASGTEYYYQDGVFYIIDALGQYRTIIPPTGALVEYLPEDYTTFRLDSNIYYRVDDTVYTLTLIDGSPYFEVLGQIR